MNTYRTVVLLLVAVVASLWGIREWEIQARATKAMGIGPDVIVGDIPDIRRWGSQSGESSFSIATTSCNIGDARLDWISNSTVHPVISQNLYRVSNGRIEQIGMSWLKHGFAVAAGDLCANCTDPASNYLGVGCSDPYGAGLNGSQGGLGPRSEVNAATGAFAWPHGDLPSFGVLDGRIRVPNSELNPSNFPGARYFVESEYIHPQDSANGNSNNNASYREAFVNALSGGNFNIEVGGIPTRREQPAIEAWEEVHSDVQLFYVDVPNDGRIIVGLRTIDLGGGNTQMEVAIENLTSHQSVRSLTACFGSGSISNPGFNDVDYQYEPYSSTDWTPSINGSEIEWSTQTFQQNQNANALRWNSLYSFWCQSDQCPTKLTLGLFRPGTVSEMTIDLLDAVEAEGSKLLDGIATGGTLGDAGFSDNQYYELDPAPTKNPIKQKVDWIMQSTSTTASPKSFGLRLESVMSGGPSGDVTQSIELFNYQTNAYELLDVRPASDSEDVIEVFPSGNVDRFVQAGTREVTARILWVSESFSGKPFFWFIDVDEAVWVMSE